MIRQILNYFRRERAGTVETLGHPAAGVIGWMDQSQGAGAPVTRETALTLAAWWCGVRIISETLATLPCIMYRRTTDDSRERATDDDRYWLVHDEPHPAMSAVTFFEMSTAHLVVEGNTYSRIVQDQLGMVNRLEPQMPEDIEVGVKGDQITYTRKKDRLNIPMAEMFHVLGLGGDGITGWSALKYGSRAISAGLSSEQYASNQMTSGATPSGLLKFPQRLEKSVREQFRKDWEEIHGGASKAGRIGIIHGGMDYVSMGMTNEAAQLIDSRKLNVRDIARILRLPPHMLADLEDSSVKANIEQQAIEFVVYSMAIWLVRWQQTLRRKLLTKEERRELYFEFLLDALLRGDIASRYTAFATARQWGWLSVNDIRRAENMNSIDGGDSYLQPMNMVPVGSASTVPDTVTSEMQTNLAASIQEIIAAAKDLRGDLVSGQKTVLESVAAASLASATAIKGRRDDLQLIRKDIQELGKLQVQGHTAEWQQIEQEWLGLFRANLECCVKIEAAAAVKAAGLQRTRGESFVSWLEKFYAEQEHRMATRTPRLISARDAQAWCEESKRQLLAAADGDPDGFCERVGKVVDQWTERAKRAVPAGESDGNQIPARAA